MARPRSDIRPRIIKAARARFLAEGVDGASLREIARDAKTNLGMIVYYFPTKNDLFAAAIEDVYAGIVADMMAILAHGVSTRERLRATFIRLGDASALELDVLKLMAKESLSSGSRRRRILARFMRGHVPLFVSAIAAGRRDGEFDKAIPIPLVLIAAVGLGALPQLARRATRAFFLLPETKRLADLSITLLFRAVGPTKSKRMKR